MAFRSLSNDQLLARIAAFWLHHRTELSVTSELPQRLRELLDEAVRRGNIDRAAGWTEDTPTETPASRRK